MNCIGGYLADDITTVYGIIRLVDRIGLQNGLPLLTPSHRQANNGQQ